jgi:hypothetical protein
VPPAFVHMNAALEAGLEKLGSDGAVGIPYLE